MSLLQRVQDRIQAEVFTSPANVVARVIGYTEDKTAMLVKNISLDRDYYSGATGVPEYLKVSLEDLDKSIAGSLRGERKTIAERATPRDLSYVKGDKDTGGIIILSGVTVFGGQTEIFDIDDSQKQVEFTVATCRWIDAAASDTEVKNSTSAFLGAAVHVRYTESSERNPQPFGSLTVLRLPEAKACKTLAEVSQAIIDAFSLNMSKLHPLVYVRASDSNESFGHMFYASDKKSTDGSWEKLSGKDAFEHSQKVNQRNWRAIKILIEDLADVEGITIEVIPGFVEFMSPKQLQQSGLFNAEGKFVDAGKRNYYTNHWTMTAEGLTTRAFFESHCIARLIPDLGIWTITAHKPVKQGMDSFLGDAKMLPTKYFAPSQKYKGLIKRYIESRQAAKIERQAEKEAGSAVGNDLQNTTTNTRVPEPFSPTDDALDDFEFEPEPIGAQ